MTVTRQAKAGSQWLEDATWIASGAINADYTSATIDTRGWDEISFQFTFSPTSDPIGDLYIQCSVDGTNFINVKIEENKMYTSDTTAITHTSADLRKVVINDPAATAYVLLKFADLFPYTRFFYDRTSGGSATGLNVGYTLKRFQA